MTFLEEWNDVSWVPNVPHYGLKKNKVSYSSARRSRRGGVGVERFILFLLFDL